MMASRFLSPHAHGHGRIYNAVEAMFDGMLRFYERTLDIALRFRFITLMVFVATVTLTVVLYVIIPKGFFPTQDTGIIIGITDVAQDASYTQMTALQSQVNQMVLKDPAVDSVVAFDRRRRRRADRQQRTHVYLAEAVERALRQRHDGDRTAGAIAQAIGGIRLFMQPAQDISVGGRLGRTQFQYTLQDTDADELNRGRRRCSQKMQQIPLLSARDIRPGRTRARRRR